MFGNSSYLSEALLAEPGILRSFLRDGPDAVLAGLTEQLRFAASDRRARVMAGLRIAKRRLALLTALADIAGIWSLEQVTGALSRFADLAVQRALELTLREAAERGEVELANPEAPLAESGMVVLGMGKLGGFELNYSSDIDLIVLFDPERLPYRGREGPMAFAVRLTRGLVYLLEHRTKDGYVFRTDLRLRPHPPGHPLALAIEDAEQYYERHGQNWERAALIKARVVAGDHVAGAAFLRALEPFLWRRHLDYAAIRDIHSIKRQINAYRGHGTIQVAGPRHQGRSRRHPRDRVLRPDPAADPRRSRAGGARPGDLRRACARWSRRGGWQPAIADELIEAYRFLRRIEHRLQMVADKQTHSLPARPDQIERFAAFMGFADGRTLSAAVRAQLERVESHYAALFESSIDLGGSRALVFTGTEDDPETLATLAEMGFAKASPVAARIRAWHHGHVRATRDARARELLTELMPRLLSALADQAEPDAAFARFDEFVTNLPAGVQLFSLFRANPRLLALVADLMGTAPRLAGHLSRHTSLFEAMLAPDFFEPIPDAATLAAEFDRALERRERPPGRPRRRPALGAGARVPDRAPGAARPGRRRRGRTEPDRDRGDRDPGAAAARSRPGSRASTAASRAAASSVLGLGKLGSRELTIGSDLDLIFIFDADETRALRWHAPAAGADLLRPARPAPDPGADRADRRGAAVRDRHAAAPVGQRRTGRLLARQLRALPADRRPDLGAPGADPRAGGGRRCRAWRPGRRDRPRSRLISRAIRASWRARSARCACASSASTATRIPGT